MDGILIPINLFAGNETSRTKK